MSQVASAVAKQETCTVEVGPMGIQMVLNDFTFARQALICDTEDIISHEQLRAHLRSHSVRTRVASR